MSGRVELFREALHQLCRNYGVRVAGQVRFVPGEPGYSGVVFTGLAPTMLPPPPDDDDASRVSIPPLPSLRGWDKDTERPGG